MGDGTRRGVGGWEMDLSPCFPRMYVSDGSAAATANIPAHTRAYDMVIASTTVIVSSSVDCVVPPPSSQGAPHFNVTVDRAAHCT